MANSRIFRLQSLKKTNVIVTVIDKIFYFLPEEEKYHHHVQTFHPSHFRNFSGVKSENFSFVKLRNVLFCSFSIPEYYRVLTTHVPRPHTMPRAPPEPPPPPCYGSRPGPRPGPRTCRSGTEIRKLCYNIHCDCMTDAAAIF